MYGIHDLRVAADRSDHGDKLFFFVFYFINIRVLEEYCTTALLFDEKKSINIFTPGDF